MTDNNNKTVPYIVYESMQEHHGITVKKLIIAIIISIALIFASNIVWLYAWMQYDYTSYEVVTDGTGNASFIGEEGDIYNVGESISPQEDK